jgi:hypothetical protein
LESIERALLKGINMKATKSLLRKFSISKNTSPVIATSIENVVASLENILDEEQFIFCPSKGFVIDIPFSSKITVGIK